MKYANLRNVIRSNFGWHFIVYKSVVVIYYATEKFNEIGHHKN